MKHLIIGDAHAKPGVSNRRFEWLGKLILDEKPDVIIDIGDWEDMPSLSSYDVGKRSYEGRRYWKDLEAAWEARELMNTPIDWYNIQKRKNKEKQYKPTMISLGGNHFEGRINKVTQLSPMLEGTINVEDGRHKDFGWEYIPFLTPVVIDGITYQHYFTSGVMGKPIGGEHPAHRLLSTQHCSCIQGHSHLFEMVHRTRPDGQRIWGVHVGAYLDSEQWEEYAGPANKMWMRGILILDNVKDGDFSSYKWVGINDIKDKYD